jgi:hypothetical protein
VTSMHESAPSMLSIAWCNSLAPSSSEGLPQSLGNHVWGMMQAEIRRDQISDMECMTRCISSVAYVCQWSTKPVRTVTVTVYRFSIDNNAHRHNQCEFQPGPTHCPRLCCVSPRCTQCPTPEKLSACTHYQAVVVGNCCC